MLVDPYFGGAFRWKGHEERHLEPAPGAGPEEMRGISAVVITHDHPDHCQPDALCSVMGANRCGLWGPAGIYRRAVEVGVDNRRVTKVEPFQKFAVGDVEILALPSKGSEDDKPCQRMSYLFSSGGVSVFHGGDSHGPSPAWTGRVENPSLALFWPNHVERAVSAVKPESVALMHCDRFEPGDFLCGYDAEEVRARLRRRARGTRLLAPAFGEWFWPERLPDEELRRLREKPRGGRRRGRDRGRKNAADRAGSRPQEPGGQGQSQQYGERPAPPQPGSQEPPPPPAQGGEENVPAQD